MNLPKFVHTITYFTLFYPIFMSILWIIGAIFYSIFIKKIKVEEINEAQEQKFTILVPVYNEEHNIYENLEHNLNLNYKNYEIWVIDDKSQDNTLKEIKRIQNDKLIVFENEQNMGKAHTLNKYIDKVKTDYFLVVDSDTSLDHDLLKYFNYQIQKDINDAKEDDKENKYVGYTGNITVKSKLKNRAYNIQKVEYRSFIDMIKRSQFIITKSIMTLSGACSCYKKEAVLAVGKFNEQNATEDINISWRFNQEGFRLKYVSQAKAEVSTPLNIYDIIKQRQRWTVGLLQTIKQNFGKLFSLKNNFLKLYIVEIFASSFWAFTLFFSSVYYILAILMSFYENIKLFQFIYGIILVLIFSIILSLIAYKLSENNNEKIGTFLRYYFWFPFAYYLIQPIGFVFGLSSFMLSTQKGIWRQKTSEKSRYLFATISDILITFILFRIILEFLEDSYTVLQNINIIYLLYIYIIIKALFLVLYYTKFRVGNKFVNRNYPVYLNVSMYLGIVNIIYNLFQVYSYEIGQLKLNSIYRYQVYQLILYVILILVSYFIFVNKAKDSKTIYNEVY